MTDFYDFSTSTDEPTKEEIMFHFSHSQFYDASSLKNPNEYFSSFSFSSSFRISFHFLYACILTWILHINLYFCIFLCIDKCSKLNTKTYIQRRNRLFSSCLRWPIRRTKTILRLQTKTSDRPSQFIERRANGTILCSSRWTTKCRGAKTANLAYLSNSNI